MDILWPFINIFSLIILTNFKIIIDTLSLCTRIQFCIFFLLESLLEFDPSTILSVLTKFDQEIDLLLALAQQQALLNETVVRSKA